LIGLVLNASGDHTLALLPFAGLLALAIGCVIVFGSETANRTLEELSGHA